MIDRVPDESDSLDDCFPTFTDCEGDLGGSSLLVDVDLVLNIGVRKAALLIQLDQLSDEPVPEPARQEANQSLNSTPGEFVSFSRSRSPESPLPSVSRASAPRRSLSRRLEAVRRKFGRWSPIPSSRASARHPRPSVPNRAGPQSSSCSTKFSVGSKSRDRHIESQSGERSATAAAFPVAPAAAILPGAGGFWPAGGSGGCPAGGCWARPCGPRNARMIVTKIQMREWGLEKFIIWKIDNRSERMGVIHDDGVTNVNRKNHSEEFFE